MVESIPELQNGSQVGMPCTCATAQT